jgi:ABC-type branched-subunit amino acid transport system substrate-binding protein
MCHLQVGSHEDESIVLARHLAASGHRRLSLVSDRSPIGVRHRQFLLEEADRTGLTVVADVQIDAVATQADEEVAALLASEPDAVVYFGVGLALQPVGIALAAQGWDGARFTGTAGLRGHSPDFVAAVEGWHYLDMYADDNPVLGALLGRDELQGRPASSVARGYDLGRLAAEALARATAATRDGVREGLERVKWLAAAEGHAGTLLGFGHRDRGALHGRYLVLRRWARGVSVAVPEGGA